MQLSSLSLPLLLLLLPLLSLLAVGAGAPTGLKRVDLFGEGAPHIINYPCYRQPIILLGSALEESPGVILAFAEGRNVTSAECAPPLGDEGLSKSQRRAARSAIPPPPSNEVGGLLLRRSLDGGATWSSPAIVFSGDIDFYTAVRDNTTGIVWLFLQAPSGVLIFSSKDQGQSWSMPQTLNVTVPAPFKSTLQPSVGHGIQVSKSLCTPSCAEAGRLIMPMVCQNGTAHGDSGQCPACHSCVVYSDNHGASWEFGGFGQAGSRESQAVQTISNTSHSSLYITERNFGPTPGHRMKAVSLDGGATFTDFGIDNTLPTPVTAHWTGIVAGIERLSLSPDNTSGRLVYAGACDPTVRMNMTLRVSADEGATWPLAKTLDPGLAGYADLVRLPEGAGVGIIYENGEATFSDRISFVNIPMAWFP